MTTNGHGLIFTSHSHQKLKEKDRRVQRTATEYMLDGNGEYGQMRVEGEEEENKDRNKQVSSMSE